MTSNASRLLRPVRTLSGLYSLAAVGLVALPLSASAANVEHQVFEIEDALGVPAIQAHITACLGEEVFLTGTVRITLTDGVVTQTNWAGMIGETADGDLFIGASGLRIGRQSSVTLVEVGAGADARQFHLQTVGSEVIVVCH